MAQLKSLQKDKLIKTSVDGIYIRDLPYKEFQNVYSKIQDKDGEEVDVLDGLVVLFNELIRAKDGTKFEDALTKEDIQDNISLSFMKEIMDALPEALGVNEKSLGN